MREFRFRAYAGEENGMILSDQCDTLASFFGVIHEQFYFDERRPQDYNLMQCSGLKDSKGNLIYEGDILKYHFVDDTVDYMPVFFKDGSFWTGKKDDELLFDDLDPKHGFRIEVAGNIYQNPELLKP